MRNLFLLLAVTAFIASCHALPAYRQRDEADDDTFLRLSRRSAAAEDAANPAPEETNSPPEVVTTEAASTPEVHRPVKLSDLDIDFDYLPDVPKVKKANRSIRALPQPIRIDEAHQPIKIEDVELDQDPSESKVKETHRSIRAEEGVEKNDKVKKANNKRRKGGQGLVSNAGIQQQNKKMNNANVRKNNGQKKTQTGPNKNSKIPNVHSANSGTGLKNNNPDKKNRKNKKPMKQQGNQGGDKNRNPKSLNDQNTEAEILPNMPDYGNLPKFGKTGVAKLPGGMNKVGEVERPKNGAGEKKGPNSLDNSPNQSNNDRPAEQKKPELNPSGYGIYGLGDIAAI